MKGNFAVRIAVGAVLVVVIAVLAIEYLPSAIALMARLVGRHKVLAAIVYVAVTATAIVVLPLSSMPLIPIAAATWGVVVGGALSILGWWIGAMVAFTIARSLGRPILNRLVGTERLRQWETRMPDHAGFFTVVLLRMVLPVEIPSYVLGLTRAISFRSYAIASLIGMTPFAFAMLAMGGAIAEGEWIRLSLTAVGVAILGYVIYLRLNSKKGVVP